MFPPHPPETDEDSSTYPPPTDRAAAFFGNNGEECQSEHSSNRSSKASPPPPLKRGIRMRQSAQCLSMGRSSSSSFSSFGSNKFFAGGVYSSAPESAFSITPSDAAVSDWPLNRKIRNLELVSSGASNGNNECVRSTQHSPPSLSRHSNKMLSNCCNLSKNATVGQKTMPAVSPPFGWSSSRHGAANTSTNGRVAVTARHRRFTESRSLSTATNWCKMRNAIAEASNGNDGGGMEALLLMRMKAAQQMPNCAALSAKIAARDKSHPTTTTTIVVAPEAVPHYQRNSAENVNGGAN
ncbi:hypothetical protein niasHT_023755 [Heterodera trifolii]|uniref:Uncharacterized protein n=1 Tax=Heterodera trifolii TaxID=157864 RepID=A0ABD2JNK0_9BILA